MSITIRATVEKPKASAVPESELIEAWNRGNLADSYIPVQEMHFQDGQGHVKRLFVEASTDADVDQPDEIQESFRRHYTLHTGTDVPSSADTPKEKRSIVMKAATGYFQLRGGDVSLRIEQGEGQSAPPKPAMCFLFLLPKASRANAWGDTVEMYSIRKRDSGRFAAYRWVYKQAFRSIWPLVKHVVTTLFEWTYRFYR